MTTQTQTLADFLLARISEDEAAARGSMDYGEGRWRWVDPFMGKLKQALVDERGRFIVPVANGDAYPSVSVADHIARHDPARVLAECEAKRALVDGFDSWGDDARWALGILALPYADHPGFREEWRP